MQRAASAALEDQVWFSGVLVIGLVEPNCSTAFTKQPIFHVRVREDPQKVLLECHQISHLASVFSEWQPLEYILGILEYAS